MSVTADEVLLVGDSRVSGYLPRTVPNFKVRVLVKAGGKLPELVQVAQRGLRSETKVLILVALHCDLTFLTNYSSEAKKGLMRLHTNTPLSDLYNVVSTWDRTWRKVGITVVWALPYAADFALYNRRRARMLGLEELCGLHLEEAQWASRTMPREVQTLAKRLDQARICSIDMAPLVPRLNPDNGSDGLHLGPQLQKRVFDTVVDKAIDFLEFGGPVQPMKERSMAARASRSDRRRRHRIARRTRSTPERPQEGVTNTLRSVVFRESVAMQDQGSTTTGCHREKEWPGQAKRRRQFHPY